MNLAVCNASISMSHHTTHDHKMAILMRMGILQTHENRFFDLKITHQRNKS